MKKIILSLLYILFCGLETFAQIPQKMSYQAIVRDNTGKVLSNTNIGLKVQILEGNSSGVVIYEEVKSSILTNDAGLLSTEIGTGNILTGDLSSIDWSKGSFYLKAQFDLNGGDSYTISTVKEIAAIPYAFYAGNANRAIHSDSSVFASNANKSIHADSASFADNSKKADTASYAHKSGEAEHAKLADSTIKAKEAHHSIYSDTAIYALSSPGGGSGGGSLNTAYQIGQVITADKGVVTITGTDGILVQGIKDKGEKIPNYDASAPNNRKMFFSPIIGAFRAGGIDNKNWDADSLGQTSFAAGFNTKATGVSSVAFGNLAVATGDAAMAVGLSTKASGNRSLAIGTNCIASGPMSIALGSVVSAEGLTSMATGYRSKAIGDGAFSGGGYSEISGGFPFPTIKEFPGGVAEGKASFAFGINSYTNGITSLAIGNNDSALGSSSIALGDRALAAGNNSLAIGQSIDAKAANSNVIGKNITLSDKATGSMYLSDASNRSKNIQNDSNRFYARFDNGYYLFTDKSSDIIGAKLESGQSAWSTVSDSSKKENFLPIDGHYVLNAIKNMQLSTWNYKGQAAKTNRHYGPLAQEFYGYFGQDAIGTIGNDTTINSADIDGVMMTAIQALVKENEVLKKENEQLKAATTALTEKTDRMYKKVEEINELKAVVNLLKEQIESKYAKSTTYK